MASRNAKPKRPSKSSSTQLMGPPPAPLSQVQPTAGPSATDIKAEPTKLEDPLALKSLGPEVKALRECLIDSAAIMAQLVNHHTDVHKIGVEGHLPLPPRGLREAWIKQAERYDNIVDTLQIQVERALTAVEWQIEQEQEKLREKETEELQGKGVKGRKPSMFLSDIPKFDETAVDLHAIHPEIDLSSKSPESDKPDILMKDGTVSTEEPTMIDGDEAKLHAVPSGPAIPKESALSRTSRSSISLTSLNRHGLKLDLSNLPLDPLNDNKSSLGPRASAMGAPVASGIEPVASPVTLAPKSARPRTSYDGEFSQLNLLDPFLNNGMEGIQMPSASSGPRTMPVASGDMMEDLFGDSEMAFSAGPRDGDNRSGTNATTSNLDPLFSPDDMIPKREDIPIDLTRPDTNARVSTDDKLLEELGFVEIRPTSMASTSAAPVAEPSLDIGSFELPSGTSNAEPGSTFDIMQQLQQHQQFGIDLNPPTHMQDGQQDQAGLSFSELGFDLFPSSSNPGQSSTADDITNLSALFNQPSGTDSKSNQ